MKCHWTERHVRVNYNIPPSVTKLLVNGARLNFFPFTNWANNLEPGLEVSRVSGWSQSSYVLTAFISLLLGVEFLLIWHLTCTASQNSSVPPPPPPGHHRQLSKRSLLNPLPLRQPSVCINSFVLRLFLLFFIFNNVLKHYSSFTVSLKQLSFTNSSFHL